MRSDLNKQLCEHERYGSHKGFGDHRHDREFAVNDDAYEDEELFYGTSGGSSVRESMRARYNYHWDRKEFGENLKPLYGWLHKNVGRRWNKLYSELCEVFDKRSVINNHIIEHLYDQLAKPELTYIGDDGKVWVRGTFSSPNRPIREAYYMYYVDPRDGVLKRNAQFKNFKQLQRRRYLEKQREELKVKRVIDTMTELHRLEGTWFEIKFQKFEGVRIERVSSLGVRKPHAAYRYYVMEYPYTFDVLKQRTVQEARVAVSKKTLSHKELKKHGLV